MYQVGKPSVSTSRFIEKVFKPALYPVITRESSSPGIDPEHIIDIFKYDETGKEHIRVCLVNIHPEVPHRSRERIIVHHTGGSRFDPRFAIPVHVCRYHAVCRHRRVPRRVELLFFCRNRRIDEEAVAGGKDQQITLVQLPDADNVGAHSQAKFLVRTGLSIGNNDGSVAGAEP